MVIILSVYFTKFVFVNLVQGKIRTVVGQVQLLVTKKFKQFKELIDMSEVGVSLLLHAVSSDVID